MDESCTKHCKDCVLQCTYCSVLRGQFLLLAQIVFLQLFAIEYRVQTQDGPWGHFW